MTDNLEKENTHTHTHIYISYIHETCTMAYLN